MSERQHVGRVDGVNLGDRRRSRGDGVRCVPSGCGGWNPGRIGFVSLSRARCPTAHSIPTWGRNRMSLFKLEESDGREIAAEMSYVREMQTWNSGGDVMLDIIELEGGLTIVVGEETVTLYRTASDFWSKAGG